MSKSKHTDLDDDLDHEGINRRQFMHRVGATTLGAGAAYYGGAEYAGSPVQNGQAVVPLVAVGLAAGAVSLGWALREYEVIGSNADPRRSQRTPIRRCRPSHHNPLRSVVRCWIARLRPWVGQNRSCEITDSFVFGSPSLDRVEFVEPLFPRLIALG